MLFSLWEKILNLRDGSEETHPCVKGLCCSGLNSVGKSHPEPFVSRVSCLRRDPCVPGGPIRKGGCNRPLTSHTHVRPLVKLS